MINDTTRRNVHVDKVNPIPLWGVKEYDDVMLKLSLLKDNSKFDVTGQTIKLGVQSATGIYEQTTDITVTNENDLDIKLKNGIITKNGVCKMDLTFKDASGQMTSASFFMTVDPKVLGDGALEADSVFDSLSKAVDKVQTDYESLKKIMIDENNAANLQNQVNQTNAQLAEITKQNFKNETSKCMAVFIDDDAKNEFLSVLKPVFDANGIKCNIAVNVSKIGTSGYMDLTQLKSLESDGFKILNHGKNHQGLDGLDYNGLVEEWVESANYLKTQGFSCYNYAVYGNGTSYNKNPTGFKFMKDNGFICGANTSRLNIDGTTTSSSINTLPINQFSINRREFPAATIATLQSDVDSAYDSNSLLVFYSHSWMANVTSQALTDLDTLIKYILSKNIQIVTLDEAINLCGNILDTRTSGKGLRISKTGVTNIDESKNVIATLSSSTLFDKLITEYELNKITTLICSTTQATNAPDGVGSGKLITYRVSDQYNYCYQEYIPNSMGCRYIRKPTSSGWDVWYKYKPTNNSPSVSSSVGTNIMTKALSAYELNTITHELCAYSNNPDLPISSKSAIATTYRLSDQYIYCYQELRFLNTNLVYIRYGKTDGTWNDFVQI